MDSFFIQKLTTNILAHARRGTSRSTKAPLGLLPDIASQLFSEPTNTGALNASEREDFWATTQPVNEGLFKFPLGHLFPALPAQEVPGARHTFADFLTAPLQAEDAKVRIQPVEVPDFPAKPQPLGLLLPVVAPQREFQLAV